MPALPGGESASIRLDFNPGTSLADLSRYRRHPPAAGVSAGGGRLRLPLLLVAPGRRALGDAGPARRRAAPPRLSRRPHRPSPPVPGRHGGAGAVDGGLLRGRGLRLRRVARPGALDRLLAGVPGLLLPAPVVGADAAEPAGPRHLPRSDLLGARAVRPARLHRLRGGRRLRLPLPPALPRPEERTLRHLLRQAAAARSAGADDDGRAADRLRRSHRRGRHRRLLGQPPLPRPVAARSQDPLHPGDLGALCRGPAAAPAAPLAGAAERDGSPRRLTTLSGLAG